MKALNTHKDQGPNQDATIVRYLESEGKSLKLRLAELKFAVKANVDEALNSYRLTDPVKWSTTFKHSDIEVD